MSIYRAAGRLKLVASGSQLALNRWVSDSLGGAQCQVGGASTCEVVWEHL